MALVKITHQSVSASPIFEFIYSYFSTFQYIILHQTKQLFLSLYKSQDKKLLTRVRSKIGDNNFPPHTKKRKNNSETNISKEISVKAEIFHEYFSFDIIKASASAFL